MPQGRRARALALLDQASALRDKGLHVETVGKQTGDGGPPAPKAADVYVFESIGGWFGVTADDFVRDVAGLDVEQIHLHLNSPGGEATEGVAIANVLRQHKAQVTVWVDGLAASAASVIAMAGDQVVMNTGAQLMIHAPWTATVGDAAEMRKAADMLDSTANALASTYAAKAGGTVAEWLAVMDEETWYTGEEAVAAGLADRVAADADKGRGSGDQVVPGASSSSWLLWDSLSCADRHMPTVAAAFAHAGRAAAPPPKTPAASADGSTHNGRSESVPFTEEHLASLRTKLGLAADADEDKIVATVAEVMDKFVEDADGLPPGAVAIDGGQLAKLQAAAEAGVRAEKRQQAEQRERLVEAALQDGRISPANRQKWLEKLEKDPGGEADLAALPKGLVPLAELGHGADDDRTDRVPDEFAALYGTPKEA